MYRRGTSLDVSSESAQVFCFLQKDAVVQRLNRTTASVWMGLLENSHTKHTNTDTPYSL